MSAVQHEIFNLEQLATVPIHEVDEHLSEKIAAAEEARILGDNLGAAYATSDAQLLLFAFGQKLGWSQERQAVEQDHFDQKLHQPLVDTDYDRWLTKYARDTSTANEAGDLLAAHRGLKNTTHCLTKLAELRGWTPQRLDTEISLLQGKVSGLEVSRSHKLFKRMGKIKEALGTSALSTVVKLSPTPKVENKPAETEQVNRRKKVIVGVLGVAAVAGAAYFASRGHVFGGGHHTQAHEALNNHPSTGATTNTISPPATHSNPPTIVKPPVIAHHLPVAPQSPAAPALHSELLTMRGDTIWAHAREHLGKRASNLQVSRLTDRILKQNHILSPRKLSVGFKFLMPKN